jgi:hypothetical protein
MSESSSSEKLGCTERLLRAVFGLVLALVLLIWSIWTAGALHYDTPEGWPSGVFVGAFFVALVAALVVPKGSGWKKGVAVAAVNVLVLCWWLTIEPSNDRDWQPNVSREAWAEIDGDEITLHEVRDCVYRTEEDYTPEWRTRKVNLSTLEGIDVVLTYWGSPYIAHPFLSFQFEDADPIAISIETRMEKGESYSTFAGFYRQFELTYVVAEERDIVRLRTDYRKGEDAYLYRLTIKPERAQAIFLDYLKTLNEMKEEAVFYNVLTGNCTTGIRMHAVATTENPKPWDWRILLPGKVDELLYSRDGFETTLPFAEYKEQSHINPVATGLGRVDDYSQIVRERVPSYIE